MPLSRRTRILATALLAVVQLGAAATRALHARGGSEYMHGGVHVHAMAQHAATTVLTTTPAPAACCPDCNGSMPCPANSGHVCLTHVGCATAPALPFRAGAAGSPGTGVGATFLATWAATSSAIPPDPPPPRA